MSKPFSLVLRAKIGDNFGQRENDRQFYERLYSEFTKLPVGNPRESILFEWLPRALSKAVQAEGRDTALGYVFGPDGLLIEAKVKPLSAAVYWNGTAFETIPYPGALNAVTDDYVLFAMRVVDAAERASRQVTILDLGSGSGMLTGYIDDEAQKRGIAGIRYINIERDIFAIAAANRLLIALGIDAEHIQMDMAASLAAPMHLQELTSIIGHDRDVIFVTRTSLHPMYAAEEILALFRYVVADVGAVTGVHYELSGCRTMTYREALRLFANPPTIPAHFIDWPSSAFDLIASFAADLGIKIDETMDLWPHFPNAHFPSFLRWSRK